MKNQAGYSLIEVIVTVVFVGIAFPGLIAFFTNVMVDSVENGVYTQAIALTQSKMEEITADKLSESRGYNYVRTVGQYPAEAIGQFTRTTTVSDTLFSGITGIYVRVTTNHSLMASPYTLATFFTVN
jgi:Tfp pilus assembly protein PilV